MQVIPLEEEEEMERNGTKITYFVGFFCLFHVDEVDNASPRISGTEEPPPCLKLLCGADLLESFGTPGLWADEDVCFY